MRAFLLTLLLLAGAGRARAEESVEFQSVVVKPGDTLWGISHKYLKDPARWDEILKYNSLPSSDPTVTLPGLVLKVPIKLIKEDLRAAKLIYRHNQVLFRRTETADWKSATDNMELFRNDALRTLDDSKARVKFLNEDLLQLDANAMAVIKPAHKDFDVELKAGGIFVGRSRVVTASAKITPKTRDTKYAATVRNDLSTLVEVYKGKAAVESQGKSVEVGEGMATDVKMGLPPGLPMKIPDKATFDLKAAEFDGDFRQTRAQVALNPAPPLKYIQNGAVDINETPDIDRIKYDVDALRLGNPISGYRVQFSLKQEFPQIAFDKSFENEEPVRPGDLKVPDGRYWVRISLIDLLGTPGVFSKPKLYVLSGGALKPVQVADLNAKFILSKLTLIKPATDEVVFNSTYKVEGRVRGDLAVLVNGRRVRFDQDGNFNATIPLARGDNAIRINLIDNDGNTESVVRTVTYQQQ